MKIMVAFVFVCFCYAASGEVPEPIIDMHLHASPADGNGPPPLAICAPLSEIPLQDPAMSWTETFMGWLKNPPCKNPIWGPETDEGVLKDTLEILERRNIYAVTSGPLIENWKKAGGERIIPALEFGLLNPSVPTPAEVRRLFAEKRYEVFAEVSIQYDGISPSDPMFQPYLAVAEELDVPVGIHIGTGPPGAAYLPGMQNYRARLHSPLVLEEALLQHPKLRVYIMHAGWPMLDDLLAVLWAHPQVHIDVGVISFVLPRKEFHRYLQRIVEAGFEKRVMFGSDQMNWPKTIESAIDAINTADFLSEEQKRDILYNNAARFLRLSKEEIAKHHRK
ncbi:amidohydrolase family protein [bacterium]|nr:amidohydrolase family protein [bacterium]